MALRRLDTTLAGELDADAAQEAHRQLRADHREDHLVGDHALAGGAVEYDGVFMNLDQV